MIIEFRHGHRVSSLFGDFQSESWAIERDDQLVQHIAAQNSFFAPRNSDSLRRYNCMWSDLNNSQKSVSHLPRSGYTSHIARRYVTGSHRAQYLDRQHGSIGA